MRAALEAMGVNVLNIDVGRPECLIGKQGVDESLGGTWYMLSTIRLTMVAVTFLLILFIGVLERLRLFVQLSREKKRAQAAA